MKLCIAIPYYGAAHALFFRALQSLHSAPPCNLAVIDVIGDSLIPRARNTLVWKFLNHTDCDHLLFIDSDILFDPAHIARIISHDTDKFPVIGGLYPKKKPKPDWVLNTYEGGPTTAGDNGLLHVKYAGTGFLLLTRTVLQQIAEKFPHRAYVADQDEEGDTRFDYFPIGPRNFIVPDIEDLAAGRERYMSEDYAFCEFVRACGYQVYVDTAVKLQHQGLISYPVRAEDVVPPQALVDAEIGRRTQSALTNVMTFNATNNPNLRLIDVDAFVAKIHPDHFTTNTAAA